MKIGDIKKIEDGKGGFIVINARDFDPGKHKEFGKRKPRAKKEAAPKDDAAPKAGAAEAKKE